MVNTKKEVKKTRYLQLKNTYGCEISGDFTEEEWLKLQAVGWKEK